MAVVVRDGHRRQLAGAARVETGGPRTHVGQRLPERVGHR